MKNSISFEERNYKHFGKCLFVSNGVIEFAASLDFGIRILRFCLCGRQNIFYEQPEGVDYLCTKEGWRVRGGHRLVFAPESDKTYWPDNAEVTYTPFENGIRLKQERDGYLDLEKSVEITFTENPKELSVKHFIRNAGDSSINGAPWAISAVGPQGILSIPFPSVEVLSPAPDRFISLWNTTSLGDKRLKLEKDRIVLKHLPLEDYFKIGLRCSEGRIKYTTRDQVFSKKFGVKGVFPDNNVNLEVYACTYMMELESLAPLGVLKPNEETVHSEVWNINPVENYDLL